MKRVFVSFGHCSEKKALSLEGSVDAKAANLQFVGRHDIDRSELDSRRHYHRRIRERVWGSCVSLFLLDSECQGDVWIEREITWSLEKRPANGMVAVLLDEAATVPERLKECGAEVIRWDPARIPGAVERAARAAGRATEPPKRSPNDELCARETA